MFLLMDVAIYCGYMLLVIAFLVGFITLLGLIVGESPKKWWKGFWY